MKKDKITIEDIDKLDKSIADKDAINEEIDMDRMIEAFRTAPKELHNKSIK